MAVEKLSISLDSDLAAAVRAAAAEQGVSVSNWLGAAADAQVRQRKLREALDALAAELGPLHPTEADRLVAAARRSSKLVAGSSEGAA
ncbi:MAG: hypothetical protein ACRDTD_21810 [Pseudonocardiaceae bacterium]